MKRILSLCLFLVLLGASYQAARTLKHRETTAAASGGPATEPQSSRPSPEVLLRAWKEAIQLPDGLERAGAVLAAASQADLASIKGLAEASLQNKDDLPPLLQRWAELDPKGAADWVLAQKLLSYDFSPIAQIWALKDMAGLTAWLQSSQARHLRWNAVPASVAALFDHDPIQALALCQKFPDEFGLPQRAKAWIESNPVLAAKALGQAPANWRGTAAFATAMKSWAALDPSAALKFGMDYEIHHHGCPGTLTNEVLAAWVEHEPHAAATEWLKLPKGHRSNTIFEKWAEKDPQQALDWIAKHTAPAETAVLIDSVIRGAFLKDPQAAQALAASLPDGVMRDRAQSAHFSSLAQKDPKAALDLAMTGIDLPNRTRNIRSALWEFSRMDAEAACKWVAEQPDGSLKSGELGLMLQALPFDNARRYEWLNTLPPGTAKAAADNVFRFSGTQAGVLEAMSLTKGPHKAGIVRSAVGSFFERNPDLALYWLKGLPPGDERNMARDRLQSMGTVDHPDAFNQFTPAKKEALLKALEN